MRKIKQWWVSVPEKEKPGLFTLLMIVGGALLLALGIEVGAALHAAVKAVH